MQQGEIEKYFDKMYDGTGIYMPWWLVSKDGDSMIIPHWKNNSKNNCHLQSAMNDFPVIGDPCFAHRILGLPGGKHCESLQRNVWRRVVSPLKAVSLDIECRILP